MDTTDMSQWIVLAVDDEPDSLEVLVEALSMHGASVHPVPGGREALEKFPTVNPNLVITDLSMPDIDGYQLLYKIRHVLDQKTVPVVALTAHAMSGDRERILAAGFSGYVSKPLRIATFGQDIAAVFATTKLADTNVTVAPSAAPPQPAKTIGTVVDMGPRPAAPDGGTTHPSTEQPATS